MLLQHNFFLQNHLALYENFQVVVLWYYCESKQNFAVSQGGYFGNQVLNSEAGVKVSPADW